MARPTKYTPETLKKISEALAMGATHELAGNYAGISHETFSQWLNKPEFLALVKEAEGKAAVKWLARIEAAAAKNWQAAAWKLERRYPSLYGRTVIDSNINVDLTKASDEELRRLAEGKRP